MPAADAQSFAFFFALFVIACGLGCPKTAATPYATVFDELAGTERRLLLIYALINVALSAVVVLGFEGVSVVALVAMFFFMSIMFPTLFALVVKNLGVKTRRASSFMTMAIAGGALLPYLMGLVADRFYTAVAYLLPMGCFAIVAAYARGALKKI